MKSLFIFLFAFYSLAWSASGRDVLLSTQKHYSQARDLTANFTQTIYYKGLKRKGNSEGSIEFKKPNKIRWLQIKPERNHYISNGKKMWLYLPDEKQVYINDDLKGVVDKIGLLFMANGDDLFKRFRIAIVEKYKEKNEKKTRFKDISSPVKGNFVTFELLPKKGEGFKRALVKISLKTRKISRVTYTDFANNKIIIELKDITFNNGLKDKTFDFVTPKDVETIKSNI